MKAWRTLDAQTALDSRWLTVHRDRVETGTGFVIDDFYTVSISDAAAVVAIDPEGRIILKEEYRYAVRSSMLEIPAGMIEAGDADILSGIRRELCEETGYASEDWVELGETVPEVSKLTNRFKIFLARGCVKTAEPAPDPSEDIRVHVLPFREAVEKVRTGEITGSVTAHAILLAGLKMNLL